MSARAQSNIVYAVEFNQSTNRFGTINLLNGSFTKISSIGGALINDIASCPPNGMLYGISNTTALVTFNKTNGAMTRVATLSVSSIQSLTFRPSDGVLFGATRNRLYTINITNGTATSVGLFGSAHNLGSTGQNIRFAQDGNLYVSNTGTNTDIYRVSTSTGAATWMGEAVGFPYLILENGGANMYGVYISLGSSTNPCPVLTAFDFNSFVVGGTNANGSAHQITLNLVGAGTNFPANFNFSGNTPQAVTNLTIPVGAVGPVSQTSCPGDNVTFSTVASGTGPYSYAWLKNSAAISGQTNNSLTLNNVSAGDAATYSVIVGGLMGRVTNSAALTVNLPVTVTVAPVSQTTVVGSNVTFGVTATGTDLNYQWIFNGSVTGTGSSLTVNNVTTNQAGIYTVIVSGACGSPATNNAALTVNVPVTVTVAPVSQTTVSGDDVTFSVTANGTGLSYQWIFNGSVIGIGSSLTLNQVTPGQAGIYNVIINGVCGSVTNSATLTVNIPVTATPLNNLVRCQGDDATFSTVASGTGPFSYAWLKNGIVISGQTGNSLNLNNVNTNDTATYAVIVCGACGSATNSATLIVNVPTPPTLSITCQEDGSVKVCAAGGVSGQKYVLLSSTDLVNWTAVSTNAADSTGATEFIDSDATNYTSCFFRTETP